jgi:hypothetical protein
MKALCGVIGYVLGGLVTMFIYETYRPPVRPPVVHTVRLECFTGQAWVPCGGIQGLVVAP